VARHGWNVLAVLLAFILLGAHAGRPNMWGVLSMTKCAGNHVGTYTAKVAGCVALVAMAILVLGARPALQQPVPSTIKPPTWIKCPGEGGPGYVPGAQCTDLKLPADWSNSSAGSITIGVARRLAKPGTSGGTLIFIPGGPGSLGKARLIGDAAPLGELGKRYDLYGFDVRGVGGSTGLQCDSNLKGKMLDSSINPPTTEDAFLALQRTGAALYRSCQKATEPRALVDHLDARQVARDMESLRRAIDIPQISVYAHSYGTLLALTYLEMYPEHVKATVLNDTMYHPRTIDQQQADASAALESAMGRVLTGEDGIVNWRMYDDVRRRLPNVPDPDDSGQSQIKTLSELNSKLVSMLSKNQPAKVMPWLKKAAQLPPPPSPALNPTPSPTGSSTDYYDDAILCSDFGTTKDWAAYTASRDAAAKAAPHTSMNPNSTSSQILCVGWQKVVNPPAPQQPVKAPVLIVQATGDVSTPYTWATGLRDTLGDQADLVKVNGFGHFERTKYGSTCAQEAINRFMLQGQRVGSVNCPADPPLPEQP
jgi:pimeloyl-ACP methyl ester carboxylesterase